MFNFLTTYTDFNFFILRTLGLDNCSQGTSNITMIFYLFKKGTKQI